MQKKIKNYKNMFFYKKIKINMRKEKKKKKLGKEMMMVLSLMTF